MSEDDDSLPPVDPVKKQTFLMIVQTAIAAAAAGDPASASHVMGRAIKASERIPVALSATQAADEFVKFAFDPPDGELAPKWTKLLTPADLEARGGPTEELVDGEWRPENPRWIGLPGDDSRYLNLLAHLRDGDEATFDDLSLIFPDIKRKYLARLLSDAEAEKLLARSSTPRGPVWRSSNSLIASRPPSSVVADVARRGGYPMPAERFADQSSTEPMVDEARWRRPDWSTNPDAMVLLSELDGDKRLSARVLAKQLPHLDRTAVARLLRRLRDSGDVKVTGGRRHAVWSRIHRTYSPLSKPKPKPAPQPPKTDGRKELQVGSAAPSKPRARAPLISAEELDRVERYVMENPGCKIGEIAEKLQFASVYRVHGITEKLYGRRIYRRVGRHYPGKDPDWK